MTNSEKLRDALGHRLLSIVQEEELSPSMVSAMVNFLKQFPPAEQFEDLPTAQRIAESLQTYKNVMPFDVKPS